MGGGASSISNGLLEAFDFDAGSSLGRSKVSPAAGLNGDRDLEIEAGGADISTDLTPPTKLPSPSRTRVSIDFSKFPPSPFRTAVFLLSSVNPMSRSFSSLEAISSDSAEPTEVPNTRDCLFLLGGDGDLACADSKSCRAASLRDLDDNGNMEDADRKPNRLPVFGGRGGGWSSVEPELLPVSLDFIGVGAAFEVYFCRINLSIAESASSASNGIGGLVFVGLYILFDAILPTRFMF